MNNKMDFNIITFHDAYNHGAVLQTYALQSFIEQMGFSVGIYDYQSLGEKTLKGKLLSSSKCLFKSQYKEKENKFEEFIHDKLHLTINKDCSVFITGSDQVWNPVGLMDAAYFLYSISYPTVKASYAASMGVSKIPEDKQCDFRKYISDFDAISVREVDCKEEIQKLIETEIDVHIDPTLLLDKSFWGKNTVPVPNLPDKYIFVYALKKLDNLNSLIDWLKKETDLPVVLIDEQGIIGFQVHHDIVLRNIGPLEFVWLVQNAECVISTSFHGTVFATLFEKELYPIINSQAPSRISNLVTALGLNSVEESKSEFKRHLDVDWEFVQKKLDNERRKSAEYFRSLWNLASQYSKRIKDIRKIGSKCTGCGCCEAVCPVGAITIELNKEGFYQPVVDTAQCISCGLCLSHCPVNKKYVKKQKRLAAFCATSLSQEICFSSSSGGVFKTLADRTIEAKGVVFGAVYSEDYRTVNLSDSKQVDIARMQKSKYVASNPNHVYQRVKCIMDEGRQVLFTGTPCQVAALKNYLNMDNKQLVTVDFVCGGMPSVSFFNEHLNTLQKKYQSEIRRVEFRSKDLGWETIKYKVDFENKKKYVVKYGFEDTFFNCFGREHISVRPACINCVFRENHQADITVADFWGYKALGLKRNNNGMSLVVVNTDKGKTFFESCSSNLEICPIDISFSDYAFKNYENIYRMMQKRETLFSLANRLGFEKAANRLVETNMVRHAIGEFCKKLKK